MGFMTKLANPLYPTIRTFFDHIVYLKHCGKIVQNVLTYRDSWLSTRSVMGLVLDDWTGTVSDRDRRTILGNIPIPKGTLWTKAFSSGSSHVVDLDNKQEFIQKMLSEYYQHLFVQGFEGLYRSWRAIVRHDEFQLYEDVEPIKPNDLLEDIKKLSHHESNTILFQEIDTVLGECRHSIIHAPSLINHSKSFKSDIHKRIFNGLYKTIEYNDQQELILTLELFDSLLNFSAKFNFQIYKFISLNKDWPITEGLKGYAP